MKTRLIFLSLLYCCISCNSNLGKEDEKMHQSSQHQPNRLINESSPYLLQHAYNPVDWRPWNEESLAEAKKTNKPLLISIGYSACHWCHVMERESFEDSSVAEIMNEKFICIKVDREERPDIDHLYMDAVQIMSGRGGWPLNCFALPNGRPFYGGTYFPKEQWMSILSQLSDLYSSDPKKVEEYAEKLSEGLQKGELIEAVKEPDSFNESILRTALQKWKSTFDKVDGGNNYAPKFPMPNNYELMLHYLYHHDDQEIKEHLQLTLEKMAFGGIYDQIGGGFARYSTDMNWKVPHFEKMLYDNAQLISLYAHAYQFFKDPLFRDIATQSIEFLNRELRSEEGAYFSALDADSEGEEGKFYTWSIQEVNSILSNEEFEMAKEYYNFNKNGEWEGRYIPLRTERDDAIASKLKLTRKELEERISSIKGKLFSKRAERIRPGLDDKSLTSWNALTIIALLDAYEAFGNADYLNDAIKTGNFIKQNQMESSRLFHSYKNGNSSINGFLEDYSFTIEAFVQLYENTFDMNWLNIANTLAEECFNKFKDPNSALFFFNSSEDPELISRKIERNDNVIPASNSSLCKALYKLGTLLNEEKYLTTSDQMLATSIGSMEKYLPYSSNWGMQLLIRSNPFQEIAIVGKEAQKKRIEMQTHYLPNSLFLGEEKESAEIDLLENKWVEGASIIYVCENKTCKQPVENVGKAIEQLRLP